jgi:hypothetical protein
MAMIPNYQGQNRNRRRVFIRPRQPRFRWALVLVPLAIIFAVWVLNNIEPTLDWDDVSNFLGVRNRGRYSMLAALGLLLLGILFVIRLYRDDEE